MKVLNIEQIRELDNYTIVHEPVPSIDLMERAAKACCDWILEYFGSFSSATLFCGKGNNGGDGLAVARMLARQGWSVQVIYPQAGDCSEDFRTNLDRLQGVGWVIVHALNENAPLPEVPSEALVVDALFGSGLSRPLEGMIAKWVTRINQLPNMVIAIDIPSGLLADTPSSGIAVEADFTLSFEVPKRAFFIPENQQYVGEWIVLPIGLDEGFLSSLKSTWYALQEEDISTLLKPRRKFDHKGIFGHALIVAGSYGKGGAAILTSRAALHAGAGLVTAHVPGHLIPILQTAVPEAMIDPDLHLYHFTQIEEYSGYSAIGIGPGLGVDEDSITGLKLMLEHVSQPLVVDADALNIISLHPELLMKLPKGSILTPHFKEFERLFGYSNHHFDRLEKLHSAAKTHELVIVLKGAHTAIATPDGNLYFNTTGNPGMATGGSGDVLTGVITGLLAQHYPSVDAAKVGVYLHGLAGDLAADKHGYEALIATDITDHLGIAFQQLHNV